MSDADMIQVVLHPVLRGLFESWLTQQGFRLARIPSSADDLPKFTVTPLTQPPWSPVTSRRITPEQRAEATAALAQWERMKAAARERAAPDLPDTWTKVEWFWPVQDNARIHAVDRTVSLDALCVQSSNQRRRWVFGEDGASVTDEDLREPHMREQMCKDCTRRALVVEGQ